MYLGQTGDEGFPLSCHWLPGRRAGSPPCHFLGSWRSPPLARAGRKSRFPPPPLFPRARAAGGAVPIPGVPDCSAGCTGTALSVPLPQLCSLWVWGGVADSKAREAVPVVSHLSGQPSPGNDSIPCQHSRPGRAHQPREQLGPCPYLSDLLTRRA